jgi:hypothetical protein
MSKVAVNHRLESALNAIVTAKPRAYYKTEYKKMIAGLREGG